jgi:hypothetical protein
MRQSQAGGIAANLHRKRLKSAVFDSAPTNSLRRAMIGSADYIEIRAIDILERVNMIRITDKAFRYTPSYNSDLGKKFRKLEQERGAAAASSKVSEAAMFNSVLPMVARRSMSKT